MQGEAVTFVLSGSGNITAEGLVKTVDARLEGSGNILCGDLQAQSAIVRLDGSGNIMVNASDELDVALNGSGNVQYRGNPANVQKTIKGSGSVDSVP
jgi:hypothetical protein